jgi:transketolase
MTKRGNSSHVGSSFSVADILSVLYGRVLKHRAKQPTWDQRDRLILSKGHAAAALYAVLAESGYFPPSRLKSYYQDGTALSGHVTQSGNPGVELSTGSLGHGLGVGVGRAKALKLAGSAARVFVILSDGECDEGSIWEAALFGHHHNLDNLVVVIDYNKIQSLASVADTIKLEPFCDKWRSFGWSVQEVNGHDHSKLFQKLEKIPYSKGKPSVLIAHTIKGKGVSFMENSVLWHYRSPQGIEFDAAIRELEKT